MTARPGSAGIVTSLRARYFRNAWDSTVSLICIAVIVTLAYRFIGWAILDGVWTARSASDCASKSAGACWAVLPA